MTVTYDSRKTDVMRLLLNASAALDNVRWRILHRDEYPDGVARAAELQVYMALDSLEQLLPLIGDDRGASVVAAEFALCHAQTDPVDDRKLCRLERGHDGDHLDSFQFFERERQERWHRGEIYDFERDKAEAFLAAAQM